jgi:hypothetical protein
MALVHRQARDALELPPLVAQSLLLSHAHAGVEPALSLPDTVTPQQQDLLAAPPLSLRGG